MITLGVGYMAEVICGVYLVAETTDMSFILMT
jgi:hypothetical protein